MAERRMFALSVVNSDAFICMPLSAQALYFHLSMRADDDGFVNSPCSIQRMIGATAEDLLILIQANYIIEFPTGIVVIRDWKVSNSIPNDRYHPTLYQDEYTQLSTNVNKSYTRAIQSVSTLESEVRLGKVSIGKVSIDKSSQEKNELSPQSGGPPASDFDYQAIVDLFNTLCPSLPKVRQITETRKKAIARAMKTLKGISFDDFFKKVEASAFLTGKSATSNWSCSFDWILKAGNLVKILEGNYDNGPTPGAGRSAVPRDYSERL